MGRLNAGQLTQRLVLLTDAPGLADGQGGHLPSVPTEREVWARMRPLRTAEKQALGLTLHTAAYEATIRHLPLLDATRVRWRGHTLTVQGVIPDEYDEYLLLTCFTSGG